VYVLDPVGAVVAFTETVVAAPPGPAEPQVSKKAPTGEFVTVSTFACNAAGKMARPSNATITPEGERLNIEKLI
jgi:hypothetical protein